MGLPCWTVSMQLLAQEYMMLPSTEFVTSKFIIASSTVTGSSSPRPQEVVFHITYFLVLLNGDASD